MPKLGVNIRKQTMLRRMTNQERQEMTLNSIAELEKMYEQGDIERHAYFIKKRALIKML